MSTTANIIGVYRNMLRLVQRMTPEKKRLEALSLIRKEFRSNASEEDPSRVEALLSKANSSMGYLKIISSKTAGTGQQAGRTRIILGAEGKKKSTIISNWSGANPDPDAVARHYSQLKRAGFTDNKSVIGSLF